MQTKVIFGSVTGMKKSLSSIALRADSKITTTYVCIIYPPLPTLYSYRKGRKPVYSLYSDGERGGYMIHNILVGAYSLYPYLKLLGKLQK